MKSVGSYEAKTHLPRLLSQVRRAAGGPGARDAGGSGTGGDGGGRGGVVRADLFPDPRARVLVSHGGLGALPFALRARLAEMRR